MKAKNIRCFTDFLAFLGKVFNKLKLIPLSVLIFKLKDKIVLYWIYEHYGQFIKNYKKNEIVNPKAYFSIPPIFVCWLQGEEQAPTIVKKCIASIKQHANGHRVIVITDSNLSQYVDIPCNIINKVKNGELSRTNFADIIRVILLATYGGMWIDATFFITKNIPENYFEYPIFSAAKQPEPRNRKNVCISRYRWTSSFIGANKGNHLLFLFLKDILLEYEKTYSIFIDYLLIDYFIYIAYSEFDEIFRDITNIPDNNIDFGWLFHSMNKIYNYETAIKMLLGNTIAFKLSYKMKWHKIIRGKITFFGKFIDENLLSN